MELTKTTLAIFAIAAATGLIWTLTVSEAANAWHSIFAKKKECVNFFTDTIGNTTAQANITCNKIVPH